MSAEGTAAGGGRVRTGTAAVMLAAGAAVGLVLGIRGVWGVERAPGLRVALQAPVGTSAAVMGAASTVLLRRLQGQRLDGASVGVEGTRIDVAVPGFVPGRPGTPIGRDELVSLLRAPYRLEEREVLDDLSPAAAPGPLTACPLPGPGRAPACPRSPSLRCASAAPAGCRDADLAGEEVTLLSSDGQDVFRLGPVLITGADIASARAVLPPPAPVADVRVPQWQIQFRLTPAATTRYAALTRRLVGKRLAIVVDRAVVTAPELQSAITDGLTVITGRYTRREASDLATALVAGELPVPLSVVAVTGIPAGGPSAASWAALVAGGLCLVALGGLARISRAQRRTGRDRP